MGVGFAWIRQYFKAEIQPLFLLNMYFVLALTPLEPFHRHPARFDTIQQDPLAILLLFCNLLRQRDANSGFTFVALSMVRVC